MAADDDDGYLNEFDEYSPHPYSGGYDIAAVYGAPLPPSPATCYPAAVPVPTAPLPPAAEPCYWPEPYDYGDATRDHHRPMYATPEVFRSWPYLGLPGPRCHSACGSDCWRDCMRGLDYLFGHSDGYGERRIGVDAFGVPVYASRKEAVDDSVVFQVAPPAAGTAQWHDAGDHPSQSNSLSWYGEAQEESRAHTTYTSYDRPYENSWFRHQSYQELYRDESCQYQEFLSYDVDRTISSQPIFSYNQHFGEQPLHILVEPPETVSSHKLEYYEDISMYGNQNNVDDLESLRHSYELQSYEHIPNEQLEPYRPSWSLNLGYYQACTEGASPDYDSHTLASGECWDMSSLFLSPFYPQEPQIYEHSYGDENV